MLRNPSKCMERAIKIAAQSPGVSPLKLLIGLIATKFATVKHPSFVLYHVANIYGKMATAWPHASSGPGYSTQLKSLVRKDTFALYQYRKRVRLGKGGFGEVSLWEKLAAFHNNTNPQLVAIKEVRLPATFSGFQSRCKKDIVREISALKELRHPNIVKYFGVNFDDQNTYEIAMELCDGTLYDLGSRNITEDEVLLIMKQVLQGLKCIHSSNKMHRDIKPANILLLVNITGRWSWDSIPINDKSVTVKIGDLGLVRIVTDGGGIDPVTAVGTPHYFAPEVAPGKACAASDIFSLGVTAYEVFCREWYPTAQNSDSFGNQWISAATFNRQQFPTFWNPAENCVDLNNFLYATLQHFPQDRASAASLLEKAPAFNGGSRSLGASPLLRISPSSIVPIQWKMPL